MRACAGTSRNRPSSWPAKGPCPSRPTSDPDRTRRTPPARLRGRHLLLAALCAGGWLLASCTQSTTFYGAPAEELHGRSLLVLQPVLIAPTPPTLHDSVVQRIEQALSELPGLGPVTGRAQWRRPDVPLGAADAYALYSSTLSLTGISDPELARRLGEQLRVDLLALAQPIFIACSVCEEGDQLWLMGLIVEARTGRIVFRAHSHAPVADDPQEMAGLAEAMAQDYLLDLGLAFQLRPHRQRFENLRPLAAR